MLHRKRRRKPRGGLPGQRANLAAAVFLAPALIGFTIFLLIPIVGVAALSFFDWNLLRSPEFIGLDNYRHLFADKRLLGIIGTTFLIAGFYVTFNLVLGLVIAVGLEGMVRRGLRAPLRLSFIFPLVISAAAVALIWRFLLNRDLGLLNWFLGLIGIDRINWLGSSEWSWRSVVLVSVWRSIGFSVLLFIAGLQSIPTSLYEAATVDGANAWQRLTRITIPLLAPIILFLTVINSINAFQLFAEPLVLTKGGPGDSSRTLVLYIYETAFTSFDLGYASTIALVLLLILLVLGAFQFLAHRRYSHYATPE